MEKSNDVIIDQTTKWIETVVIGLNFCPFAAKVMRAKKAVRYTVCRETDMDLIIKCLRDECAHLDSDESTATTLVILPEGFDDFYTFLDLVEKVENHLLVEEDYEGIYQIATFHPDYLFDESEPKDAANFTNRSPYPMLHLLREKSIDDAIEYLEDAEKIPERNIELARKRGFESMKALREACFA